LEDLPHVCQDAAWRMSLGSMYKVHDTTMEYGSGAEDFKSNIVLQKQKQHVLDV